jgi:hypothetical protein
MKTDAGLLWQPGQDREIVDADLGDLVRGAVRVQLAAPSADH